MDKQLNPDVQLLRGHICNVGCVPPGRAGTLEACKRALERPGGQIFILQAAVTVHGCVNG